MLGLLLRLLPFWVREPQLTNTASGTNGTAPLTDEEVAQPEAEVTFDTYTVNVSATYNHLPTGQYVKLMKFGDETKVLPRIPERSAR